MRASSTLQACFRLEAQVLGLALRYLDSPFDLGRFFFGKSLKAIMTARKVGGGEAKATGTGSSFTSQ